jgi:hypothetical protein
LTEAPPTNGELVRALIRAVDNSNHSAIAALTAKDAFPFRECRPD